MVACVEERSVVINFLDMPKDETERESAENFEEIKQATPNRRAGVTTTESWRPHTIHAIQMSRNDNIVTRDTQKQCPSSGAHV